VYWPSCLPFSELRTGAAAPVARGPDIDAMRLLLVEDYVPLRHVVPQGLKEAGFAVDASGDRAEGLWYA
jgi:hypothetical protein